MKRVSYLMTFVFAILFSMGFIKAYDVDLYLFYSSTCPHCKAERIYLKELQKEYDYLTVHEYEVRENIIVTEKVKDGLGINWE